MDWSIEFLQSLIKFFTFDKIIAILGLFAAWIGLSPQWKERSQQQTLRKEFGGDLFPADVIERSTRYYIEPYCDVMDPSREAEIRHALPSDRSLFGFIDGFLSKTGDYRHMIILADSGMGMTSALLSYYWYNRQKRESKRHRIAVVALGIPNADEYIQQIDQKRETILFLDAFDEDTKAKNDHLARIETLMELGLEFSHIILTSRTQFFPTDEEIPTETGIIRVGPTKAGQGKVYKFQKSYLLPLTDKQVTQYIHKRYPFWQWEKRKSAKQTADKIPNLRVRPMLLAFIPDLLVDAKTTINHSYELYEALIQAWLERESDWVDKNKLSQFSKRLAVDLYVNRERRGAERIHYDQLMELAEDWDIQLDAWQITGRSLLNRDAEGNYKFAHRSIMEYLFLRAETTMLDVDWQGVVLTDQMKLFIKEMVGDKRFDLLHTFPGADLSGVNLKKAKLYDTNLYDTNLYDTNLSDTNLSDTNLSDTNLSDTNLSDTNLSDANLSNANLSNANLYEADLSGADLSGADLSGADLRIADLYGVNLKKAHLSGSHLSETRLYGADLSGAHLTRADIYRVRYDKYTKWPNGFDYQNSGAIGPRANLIGTDLTQIDLSRAHLSLANLRGTDLTQANLKNADLNGANLTQTDLKGADLSGADLSGADLKGAKYNSATKWPDGFDYRNSGAINVEN